MGNEQGKNNSRLGICAMAFTTTNIEEKELLAVTAKLKALADTGTCTREEFDEALKEVETFAESDIELFTRLFTMFDNTGDNVIPIKEYLAGVGGILVSGSVQEKLAFAFKLYDLCDVGTIDRANMKRLLNSINLVTSYFGDPVVSPADIDKLTFDTFQSNPEPTAPMPIAECVPILSTHEITEQFVEGKGTVKFGR
jgi:Ca2+-binding EF-hand superfamily protein